MSASQTAAWAWTAHLQDAATTIVAAGVPRACLWSEHDTLLPPWVGQRTAEALAAPLLVVTGRHPDERVGHDWPWRHPTFFAKQVDEADRAARTAAAAALTSQRAPG